MSFKDFVNVYEFTCELPGSKEEVMFKPVNTGQLKRLLTYENEKNPLIQERALDDLISSSVLTEGFNISDLYLEDRFFLLVELRKKTKGEVIEFQLPCPKCNSQSLNRVDLNDLPVQELDEDIDKTVKLSNNITVILKHVKRSDQMQISPNIIKPKMSDLQAHAELQLAFHTCYIDKLILPNEEIKENLSLTDRVYLIENIPTGEYDKIKEKIDEISFGLDLGYEAKCRQCDFKIQTDVPVESSFFS